MGRYVMLLPLHGVALRSQGFDNKRRWQLLRLRSPHTMPSHPADAALIRLPQDVPAARSSGFATALVVDDSIHIENGAPPELAVVANRFDYLSDGDVLGFQPLNGRFRTLYRKASAHNSFLVTERCNHYCLMCSQPPRDIDDLSAH